jgi:hypothetical protein
MEQVIVTCEMMSEKSDLLLVHRNNVTLRLMSGSSGKCTEMMCKVMIRTVYELFC